MSATSEAPASFRSSAVRPGSIGLLREALGEVLSRRRLVGYLVRADVRKNGANTFLGNVWWVLDPFLLMLVYVVLVAVVFDRGVPDYPLFVFCAVLPWKWFSSSIGDAISSVTGGERLIKQVQFPKLVLPLASAGSEVVSFAFGLIPLVGMLILLYPHRLEPTVLLIPLIAVVQFAFTLSLAVGVAAVNVFFRDIGNISRHVLRLWFYLSPGLYSVEQLRSVGQETPVLVEILLLNPFAVLFTAYRDVVYEGRLPNWPALMVLLLVSFVLLALTTIFFKRVELAFAKVL